MMKRNTYALYINELCFGPFTTSIRGHFDWALKTKKDRSMAEDLPIAFRAGCRADLVDCSGSVLNVNCQIVSATQLDSILQVKLIGGEGL